MRVSSRSPLIVALLAVGLFAYSEPATRKGVEIRCHARGEVLTSLLAVGDTGRPRPPLELFDTQYVVGRAMAREHRLRPVDALVFLGDNFYPHGLIGSEVVERVRDNLVSPYCDFLALEGPRSAEVAEACEGRLDVPPVRVLAVLGNHDHHTPESPRLQREVVPRFVSNWSVPAGLVENYQLGGLSLTLFDSALLHREEVDPAPLAEALRRTPGPWRVLVAHHPVGARLGSGDRYASSRRYEARVRAALEQAGVPVHALLAGHEHNLQAITASAPLPPLTVVSGGGSSRREVEGEFPGAGFEQVSPGFARLDLVRDPMGEERLLVSWIATARYLPAAWSGSRVSACWSVSDTGRVRDESGVSVELARTSRPSP